MYALLGLTQADVLEGQKWVEVQEAGALQLLHELRNELLNAQHAAAHDCGAAAVVGLESAHLSKAVGIRPLALPCKPLFSL